MSRLAAVWGLLVVVGGVSACGSSATEGTGTSSSAATSSSTAVSSVPGSSSQASPTGLVVDVTISGGKVTPRNASYDATVKEPISFRVSSDTEDELHVHSTPDHEFEITAAPNQIFDFTVDVPGRVDVELHHLNVVIATITVR